MSFKIIFFQEFGKAFVPKKLIPGLRSYFIKAGFEEVPYKFFGFLFYFSAFLTTAMFLFIVFPLLKGWAFLQFGSSILTTIAQFLAASLSWFLVQAFFALFFIAFIYFYLDLKIYKRTRKMEEQLADFLQMLSSNLKGGLTFEKALWAAIKPRFGVLGDEMAKTSKRVMTGTEIGVALSDLADKYDSLLLRRTVDLMVSEVDSGGNVAQLIDRIVDNLKQMKELKDEMSASALSYIIFISIIVVLISPLLFALSFNLLQITLTFLGKLSGVTSKVSQIPIKFTGATVNPNDFKIFSVIAITIISFFSSMIVSIVEKGNIKAGLKYIPIFIFGSIFFYYVFLRVLTGFFGGITAT